MVGEVGAPGSQHLLGGRHGVAKLPERARDAEPPQPACEGRLDRRRLDFRATAASEEDGGTRGDDAEDGEKDHRKQDAELLHIPLMWCS